MVDPLWERLEEGPVEPPVDACGDIVVLPREAENGIGFFDDSVITIVKELRNEGVSADFSHSSDKRQWIGENAAPVLVIDLIAGVLSHAGWSALVRLFRGPHAKNRVRIRVVRYRRSAEDVSFDWYKVEGDGTAVADALDQLKDLESNDSEQASEIEAASKEGQD